MKDKIRPQNEQKERPNSSSGNVKPFSAGMLDNSESVHLCLLC